MAEQTAPKMLARSPSIWHGLTRPNLVLYPEQGLGIGKLQIAGSKVEASFRRLLGFDPPPATRQITVLETSIAWLSPNEWLLCGPEAEVLTWLARIDQQGCDDTLAIDLSHARAPLRLGGAGARDALAAVCPLDLWSENFAVGTVARSLLGETGMFIARLADLNDGPQFRIIVDQTMLAYAARVLADPITRPGT